MKKHLIALSALLSLPIPLLAASFVAPPATGPQTLGAGETGVVEFNGVIDGAAATAVTMSGVGATLTNAGLVESSTGSPGTVVYSANNPTIINSGTIIGTNTYAITGNAASNLLIRNTGLISAPEDYIIEFGTTPDYQILNYGQINGLYYGIYVYQSDGGIIVNEGTISMTSEVCFYITDSNATQIINNGLITSPSYTFDIESCPNTTLTNSGTIIGPNSDYALYFLTSPNTSLTLMRGSNIQGGIYSDTPLNVNVENGLNLALTITGGVPIGNLGIKSPYVVTGDPVLAVIDPTGLALQADVTADISDAILDGIYLHRRRECGCSSGLWVEGLGSYRQRDSSELLMSYNDWQGGGQFGYDFTLCEHPLSLFAGASYLQARVSHGTQEADVISAWGGVSYECCFWDTFFGFSAVGAYINWDNKRYVMNNLAPGGIETAKVNMNRGLFAAEATLGRPFCFFWDQYATFTLRYAGLYLGSYTEHGSLANLTVSKREVDLLTTRFETTLGTFHCRGCLEPYIGLLGRFQVGGYRVEGDLLGSSLSFNQGGPRNLAAVLGGVRGVHEWKYCNSFINCEVSFDSWSSTRVVAEGGLSF